MLQIKNAIYLFSKDKYMGILYYILLGMGLSIDSFTASVSSGVCISKIKLKDIFRIALFMSFFQALMPFIGWILGIRFQSYIESYDHWIAFLLLGILGVNMIYSSITSEEDEKIALALSMKILIGMGIATSIDAMAVGVSFGVLDLSIMLPIFIIGAITFIFSFFGAWFGNKLGNKYNSGLELFAGIVLFGLGTKILIEHTCM